SARGREGPPAMPGRRIAGYGRCPWGRLCMTNVRESNGPHCTRRPMGSQLPGGDNKSVRTKLILPGLPGLVQDHVLLWSHDCCHGGLLVMAGKLLPDELWNEIAPLFPEYVPSPEGGRHPKDNRVVLTAILFILKTGIAWEDLPQDAFGCSY